MLFRSLIPPADRACILSSGSFTTVDSLEAHAATTPQERSAETESTFGLIYTMERYCQRDLPASVHSSWSHSTPSAPYPSLASSTDPLVPPPDQDRHVKEVASSDHQASACSDLFVAVPATLACVRPLIRPEDEGIKTVASPKPCGNVL